MGIVKCVFLSVSVACLVCVALSFEVFAVGVEKDIVRWSGAFGIERSRGVEGYSRLGFCSGVEQNISLKNDTTGACVYGSSAEFSFAQYEHKGSYRSAVSYPYDSVFHDIQVCSGEIKCVYSAKKDSLFILDGSTLKMARGFSEKLTRSVPAVLHSGVAGEMNVGLSQNGGWLVVSDPISGFYIYDIAKDRLKRIDGFINFSDKHEVAIANNGATVMVYRGYGAPYHIFTDSCEQVCDRSFAVSNLMSALVEVYDMRFSYDDSKIVVIGKSRAGSIHEYILYSGDKPPESHPDSYLAFGDSFTSGEGETDDSNYFLGTNIEHEKCHLSKRSYPYILGIYWRVPGNSVACSGAVTKDVLSIGHYGGQGGRLTKPERGLSKSEVTSKQFESIEKKIPGRVTQETFIEVLSPGVVSIGIGGNDIGLMSKLKSCSGLTDCDWVSGSGRQKTKKEIYKMQSTYKNLFSSLKNRHPSVSFVAVGYPLPVDVTGPCTLLQGYMLSSKEREYMNEVISLLNIVMEKAAKESMVGFVDISQSYNGNRLCQKTTTPAMNGIRLGDDMGIMGVNILGSESFHPTPHGHALVFENIKGEFPEFSDARKDCDCESSVTKESDYWKNIIPNSETPTPVYDSDISDDVVGPSFDVDLPKGLGEDNYSIVIRSEEVVLHESSELEGGLGSSVEVILPNNFESGYHTLVIKGRSPSGEPVEIYKDIFYGGREPESVSLKSSSAVKSEEGRTEKNERSHLGSAYFRVQPALAGVKFGTVAGVDSDEIVSHTKLELSDKNAAEKNDSNLRIIVIFTILSASLVYLFYAWLRKRV